MHVSRPLVALLAGTVVFFALWITALKPGSGPGSGHQALGQLQPAINKACSVPGLVHAPDCNRPGVTSTPTTGANTPPPAHGAAPGTGAASAQPSGSATPSTSSASKANSHSNQAAKPGTHGAPAASPKTGFAAVQAGLRQHKVLALLFYNPASADDRAVHQELASVPTHRGAVVKVAVPLQQLSKYSTLLNQVPVNFSPTLVLINAAHQADEIVGFADAFEIERRVAAAVGVGKSPRSGSKSSHS
jgi:hypothetical protein